MNIDLIRRQVAEIILANTSIIYSNTDVGKIKNLIEDLGLDSITIMQLIIDIEQFFEIQFDDDLDYEEIQSFEQLCSYIEKKLPS